MRKIFKRVLSLILVACCLLPSTACYGFVCNHNYTESIQYAATCNTQGTKNFSCSLCGHTYSENYSMPELTANEVFERSKNAVGEIITYDRKGNELSLGTCFTASSDGKILTNYHVIEDAYSAKISLAGRTYTVQSVLAYDKELDLAVLKINANNLTVISPCTNTHAVGKAVYAIGSSRGLTETFSQGIITSADRVIGGVHYVQHDAAISSGNSGGPLINSYGEIIGINTMLVRDAQNLNFAISIYEIQNLVFGTPLTMAQFYEKECDAFIKMVNYVTANGKYDRADNEYSLTLGTMYNDGYAFTRTLQYFATDGELWLSLMVDNDYYVVIIIDEIDGEYGWGYFDGDGNYMIGVITAPTYTDNTLLGYDNNNITSSSLRADVRELSSMMVTYLLNRISSDLSSIGVTAADLGFYYFN